MNWINILHFYQPPTSSNENILEAVNSSYRSWADFLLKHKNVKVTINFTACLTQKLVELNQNKLIKDFVKLAKRGQIEFLESAAFHPILPLIPEKEIINQIKINNNINKQYFGRIYKPKGFFLPEMAYSKKVANIIKKLGYRYIILDEISSKQKINTNIKYTSSGLNIVFRNNKISKSFVPETILNKLENGDIQDNESVITATDGELYGHWYWNWWPKYEHLTKKIKTLTVLEYLKKLNKTKKITLLNSSWESLPKEINNKLPYVLWSNPNNKIHTKLWQLANFALKLNYSNKKDPNHFSSRLHLEKGLSSCTFWWASGKDFRLFSEPAWHPEMIEIGAKELLLSIRSLVKVKSSDKIEAEKIFNNIHKLIWKKHWQKHEKRNTKKTSR